MTHPWFWPTLHVCWLLSFLYTYVYAYASHALSPLRCHFLSLVALIYVHMYTCALYRP